MKLLIMSPVTSYSQNPYTFLSTMFSSPKAKVLPLMWEAKFCVYTKQKGKFTHSYDILIIMFFRLQMGRQKIMNQMVASLSTIYWLLISSCMQFLLVGVIIKKSVLCHIFNGFAR